MRPAVISIAVLALVGVALSCDCDGDVQCFVDLGACLDVTNPAVRASSDVCLTLLNPRHFYRCETEAGSPCRSADTCGTVPEEVKCECSSDIKCYKTLHDCREEVNSFHPAINDAAACAAHVPATPYYSCWEEVAAKPVCRSTSTCKIIPPGTGNQDPHFRGFDGSEFYFDGEAGRSYNLITDASLNVNAEFVRLATLRGTYMGRLGLRFGRHVLTFDPAFGVVFGGALLTRADVELPEGSFSVDRVAADGRLQFAFQNDAWSLRASVGLEKGDRGAAYVNLAASIIGHVDDPHGILGQTARFVARGAKPIPDGVTGAAAAAGFVGAETDYLVRDGLVGVDFAVNRFNGNATVAPFEGARLGRETQPLFEAVVA